MLGHIGSGVLLFSAALVASIASASPVQYTLGFSVQSGIGPTAGSFTYDAVTTTFTDFKVTWDGFVWDLTNSANNPSITGSLGCLGGLTGAAASFAQLSGACLHSGPGPGNSWLAGNDQPPFQAFKFDTGQAGVGEILITGAALNGQLNPTGNHGTGQWSITAAPEPGSWALLTVGASILALMRRHRRS
jgi:PEP-CTERM motif-containing protein